MFKFKKNFFSSAKLLKKLRLKSNSPILALNFPRKVILGGGAFGLTLGLIYFQLPKRYIHVVCERAKEEDENIGHSTQTPLFRNDSQLETKKQTSSKSLDKAIEQSKILIERFKIENGLPGIVVGVSINGKEVWSDGFGFSDIENGVPCCKDTVMRIASISKCLTIVAAAKLWEEGKLDWDKSILSYLPGYPEPKYKEKTVTITPGQLASHLGGIRHYQKTLPDSIKPNPKNTEPNEFDEKEYLIKEHYESVSDALKMFQNDPLLVSPGSKYLYTTHGYTLLSAIIETIAKEPFHIHMLKLFKTLGLENTFLDRNDPLIYNRSRYYYFKNGVLLNTPYVDNSYKWGGGGFLSTVGDLLKFGNIMLFSSQCDGSKRNALPGFLKADTVKKLWGPVTEVRPGFHYGMGFFVQEQKEEYGLCKLRRHVASHSGGAIGASSILLILPRICFDHENNKTKTNCSWDNPPEGIIVAILVNLTKISCFKLGLDIAQLFDEVDVKNL